MKRILVLSTITLIWAASADAQMTTKNHPYSDVGMRVNGSNRGISGRFMAPIIPATNPIDYGRNRSFAPYTAKGAQTLDSEGGIGVTAGHGTNSRHK